MADHGPGLRKRATAAELAALPAWERWAYRAFETAASLRLAVFMMCWLGIEVIAGTLIESRVNAPAAKYLVYGSLRFNLCLAMLAVNMASAALIRLPWQRRHTGFVITHVGVIMMIFGASLTLRDNVDAQLQAKRVPGPNGTFESPWAEKIEDSASEVLIFEELDPKTLKRSGDAVPLSLDLGPFTWGDRLWGIIPWRNGHEQRLPLPNGDEVRVVKFFADADAQESFVRAEETALGTPVAQVRLVLDAAQGERDLAAEWAGFGPEPGIRAFGLRDWRLVTWAADTVEEFEHYRKAVPPPPKPAVDGGLRGTLEIAGKTLLVDDLIEKPAPLPGGAPGDTIQALEYYPDAIPGDRPGTLKKTGDDPRRLGLKLKLVRAGKAVEAFVSADPDTQARLAPAAVPGLPALAYAAPGEEPTAVALAFSVGGKFTLIPYKGQGMKFTVPGLDWKFTVDVEFGLDGVANVDQAAAALSQQLKVAPSQLRGRLVGLTAERGGQTERVMVFSDPLLARKSRGSPIPELFATVAMPKPFGHVEVVRGPDGRFGFHAWGDSGLAGSGVVKAEEAAPALPVPRAGGVLNLVVSDYLERGRPDQRIFPRVLQTGAEGHRAMVVEYRSAGAVFRTSLARELDPNVLRFRTGERLRAVRLKYTPAEATLPFKIRLDDFKEPKIPGTDNAAAFISIVTVDDGKNPPKQTQISMNQPLRQVTSSPATGLRRMFGDTVEREYKLYQSNISHVGGDTSTYTVGYDPGLWWKVWGGIVMSCGIALMLVMRGVSRELLLFFSLATTVLVVAYATSQYARERKPVVPPPAPPAAESPVAAPAAPEPKGVQP